LEGKPPRASRWNWTRRFWQKAATDHAYAEQEVRAFSSYLHSARLSCEAMICHVPPRFSHVSVQTWQTFAFGSDLSLPT
jgi:hypothetical protein